MDSISTHFEGSELENLPHVILDLRLPIVQPELGCSRTKNLHAREADATSSTGSSCRRTEEGIPPGQWLFRFVRDLLLCNSKVKRWM